MSKHQVTSQIEKVSPELALEFLCNNNRNRPLTMNLVERIRDEIKAGNWQLNGSAIRFDWDGNILDGQHRLYAISEGGKTVESLVVRGLDPASFSTIDTNCRSRKNSDILGIQGETNSNTLSAALNFVCRYEQESLASTKSYSVSVLQEALEKHPGIRQSVAKIAGKTIKLFPGSAMAFLHYMFSKNDPQLADAFYDVVANQTGLEKYAAFALFYSRLINNYTSKTKFKRNEIVIVAVKAWNAQRAGKTIKNLSFNNQENAPQIQ